MKQTESNESRSSSRWLAENLEGKLLHPSLLPVCFSVIYLFAGLKFIRELIFTFQWYDFVLSVEHHTLVGIMVFSLMLIYCLIRSKALSLYE